MASATAPWPEDEAEISSIDPPASPLPPTTTTDENNKTMSSSPIPADASSPVHDDGIAWNQPPTTTTTPTTTTAALTKKESEKTKKPSAIQRARKIICKLPDPTILFIIEVCAILLLQIIKPHVLRTWSARIITPLLLIPTIAATALWRPTHIIPASSSSSSSSQNNSNNANLKTLSSMAYPSSKSVPASSSTSSANATNQNTDQQQQLPPQAQVENPYKPIPNAKSIVQRGDALRLREAAVIKKEEELRRRTVKLEETRRDIQLKLPPAASISKMLSNEAAAANMSETNTSFTRKPLQQ